MEAIADMKTASIEAPNKPPETTPAKQMMGAAVTMPVGMEAVSPLLQKALTIVDDQAKRTRTQTTKVCLKGHPLRMRTSPFMRKSEKTGKMDTGTSLACWGCKIPIYIPNGYFRCSYMGCDYDVGPHCGLIADLAWCDVEEEPIDDTQTSTEDESPKAEVKEPDYNIDEKCRRGHKMTMWTTAFARDDIHGTRIAGQFIKCRSCKKDINVAMGYFRCRYTGCNEDYCTRCSLAAGLDFDESVEAPIEENRLIAALNVDKYDSDAMDEMNQAKTDFKIDQAMKLRKKLMDNIEANPEDFDEFSQIYGSSKQEKI